MSYEYNKDFFTDDMQSIIDFGVMHRIDKNILDLATKLDKNNEPIYDRDQICEIIQGGFDKLSEEQINTYSELDENGKPVYDRDMMSIIRLCYCSNLTQEMIDEILKTYNNEYIYSPSQMNVLRIAFRNNFSFEQINLLNTLNKKMEPVYDASQMMVIVDAILNGLDEDQIKYLNALNKNFVPIFSANEMKEIAAGFTSGLSKEQIDKYCILDENEAPIYFYLQMQDIKLGFINGLDEELIDIYSQLENGKPKFDHVEMGNLRFFFERANKAQIKLIKECIDEKIDYENFSPFLLDTIPIEKMRIYKSIYLEDINKEYINETINVNELSYEELKDVKYLINCAKELFPKENFPNMKLDYIIKQREDQEVNPSNITINLLNYTYNLRLYEKKCIDIVERCLSYKMPPEQLAYLTNPEFSLTYEEMKDVAIGLLNGLTPNEIEAVSGSELKGRALAEAIDNATRDKFFNLDDIEREIEVKTDWFDEIEKEM